MVSAVNFIPSKFGSFPETFWKVVLHTRLNVYRESSGYSWFVTNNLLVYYKWSETWSISCTVSIFSLIFIRVCAQYQFKTINNFRYLFYMFFWNYFAIPKTLITSRFGYVFHVTQLAKNIDLILTILLKYICSWIPFPRSFICKNVNTN